MRFKGSRQSKNIEDQTGRSSGMSGNLLKGGGIGGILIVVVLFFLQGGNIGNLGDLAGSLTGGESSYTSQPTNYTDQDERKEFASVVFGHLEDYWEEEFTARQETYTDPTMVFFTDQVQTACGGASSAVGPFYCPGDQKVYIDLSFADELANKYGAAGDFALAYVIAHEVGHHVQNELGISAKVQQLQNSLPEKEGNEYSVRLELQADYLAGCFAKYLEGETYNGQPILETGDIEEALVAANSIGDDTLQKEYQGYVVPDSFTHGTSAQRVAWFNHGVKYGTLEKGDTFSSKDLDHPGT